MCGRAVGKLRKVFGRLLDRVLEVKQPVRAYKQNDTCKLHVSNLHEILINPVKGPYACMFFCGVAIPMLACPEFWPDADQISPGCFAWMFGQIFD